MSAIVVFLTSNCQFVGNFTFVVIYIYGLWKNNSPKELKRITLVCKGEVIGGVGGQGACAPPIIWRTMVAKSQLTS